MNGMAGYVRAARSAGCPPDQVKRFMDAEICLQPKQLLAAAAARDCDKPGGPVEIGYGGARGGGKSAWSIAQLVADDCMRVPGLKVLLLRNMQRSARESLQDLRANMLMRIPHTFSAHKGQIDMPNGSRLLSGHFSSEKDIGAYLGIEYDIIAIEEATSISWDTFLAIKSSCRSSKPGWRPRVYCTTNPGGRGHGWFKKRFIDPHRAGNETETRFIPATVDDNLALSNRDEYIKVLESQTGWRRRAWRHGDWDVAAGQYFTAFSERHHVIDDFDPLTAVQWEGALDYGFQHFTAVTLGATDGDGNRFIVDMHAARKWLVPMHADAIHGMLGRQDLSGGNGDRFLTVNDLKYFCAGTDVFAKTFSSASVAEEYAKHGIKLRPANMDRRGGWARLLSLMGDPDNGQPSKLFIHRRCKLLIDQITDAVHSETDPEDVEKTDCGDDGEGGDDALDSARYLLAYRTSNVQATKLKGF
jgi:phage terminase large subunit